MPCSLFSTWAGWLQLWKYNGDAASIKLSCLLRLLILFDLRLFFYLVTESNWCWCICVDFIWAQRSEPTCPHPDPSMLCTLLVHSYVTNAPGPRAFCFASDRPVCVTFVCYCGIAGRLAECLSPLQLKPAIPPGSGGPGLQDSWGSPDSPAHLVWSKARRFAARWLDRICSLPATLHPQALHLIRITCHVSYITWVLGVSCQPKKCDSYSLLCTSVTARSQDRMHLEPTVLKV